MKFAAHRPATPDGYPESWEVWLPGRWPGYREFHKTKGHWATTAKLKKAWQNSAALILKAARIPHLDKVHLHYSHTRKDRRHDKSNLAFGAAKIIEDALQDAGIIDNDGWNYVDGFGHAFHVGTPEGIRLTVLRV